MHLVDRDRARCHGRDAWRRSIHSSSRPLVRRLEDDRRRARRHLGRARDRVGLQAHDAVGAAELELVGGPRLDARDEELPDAGRPERAHRVRAPSQTLKSPTTPTARADGAHTANAVPATPSTSRTCAPSTSPSSLVAALADQVQVELAERRQERVRVRDRSRTRRRGSRPRAGTRAGARALDDALEQGLGHDGVISTVAAGVTDRAPRAAPGRNARTTTPSAVGCAPSTACGSWWSREEPDDVVVERHTAGPRRAGGRSPPTGTCDPVGPVVELVAQLVDRLLELEERRAAGPGRRRSPEDARRPRPPSRGTPRGSAPRASLPIRRSGVVAVDAAQRRRDVAQRAQHAGDVAQRRSACGGARSASGPARPRSRR